MSNQGPRRALLEGKQQQQRDHERKDPERFGDRKSEDQVAELTLSGRRIAQSRGKVVAENRTDPDARTSHADAGNSRADKFRSNWIHVESSSSIWLSETGAFS